MSIRLRRTDLIEWLTEHQIDFQRTATVLRLKQLIGDENLAHLESSIKLVSHDRQMIYDEVENHLEPAEDTEQQLSLDAELRDLRKRLEIAKLKNKLCELEESTRAESFMGASNNAHFAKKNRRSTVRNLASIWPEKIGKSVGTEWTRQSIHKLEPKKNLYLLRCRRKSGYYGLRINDFGFNGSGIPSYLSKFDECIGDSRKRVLRTRNEVYYRDCLKRAVKFPASVMVWGCMPSKGVGNMHLFH